MEICFMWFQKDGPKAQADVPQQRSHGKSLQPVGKPGGRREAGFCSAAGPRGHRGAPRNGPARSGTAAWWPFPEEMQKYCIYPPVTEGKNELNRANKAEAKLLCIADCLVFGMWTKCFRL